jgi:hypothetical protein
LEVLNILYGYCNYYRDNYWYYERNWHHGYNFQLITKHNRVEIPYYFNFKNMNDIAKELTNALELWIKKLKEKK